MKGYMITSRSSGEVPKTIAVARLMRSPKKNKERLKQAIDTIKVLMKEETDPYYKDHLATTGLMLNNLFLLV